MSTIVWFIACASLAQDVLIEKSEPLKGGRGLGTAKYSPTGAEASFLKKVTEKEIATWTDIKMPRGENQTEEEYKKMLADIQKARAKEIPAEKYQLADQVGQYVGWFGILRQEAWDDKAKATVLLFEHKYFDGLVDLHQQIVSIYGAGDFTATLRKKKTGIPLLALVRVYGKVAKDKNGSATLAADHIRYWDWGLFAFMDYGLDKTKEKWVKLRRTPAREAYSARPSSDYYESLLGKRE